MTGDEALKILKTGQNAFLTGPAGSGKTHLLNQYIEYLKSHGVPYAVTASTGIAATHLGGQTIHSWSGIGVKNFLGEYDLEAMEEKSHLWKRIEPTAVLVIDEISMLHNYQLDMIDKVLRQFKRNDLPFGGVQVVLCGDFFQLPPVGGSGNGKARFAYHSQAWAEAKFNICYLKTQYRHQDEELIKILSAIRDNSVNDSIRSLLTSRQNLKIMSDITPTRLHTHNANVDQLNQKELNKLPGQSTKYIMTTKGKKALVEQLVKSCLAPEELELKEGAQVMFVKNNFDSGFANGTLGVVTKCGFTSPTVKLTNGKEIEVEPATWTIEEDGKVKAQISQIPLRLAWAITVHKSQGMSLDAVSADLSQAFERGMGYVALSRVRKFSGLFLEGLSDLALEINREAYLADQRLKMLSGEVEERLAVVSESQLESQIKEFISKHGGKAPKKKVSTYDITKELVKEKLSLEEIAKEREMTIDTIINHLEKLTGEDKELDISYLKKSISPSKFQKISSVFKELEKKGEQLRLSPVKNKLSASVSFNDIKLARLLYGLKT